MRLASDCSCLSLAMRLSRFLCANPAYPHPLDLPGRPHGQCPDCPTGLLPLVPDLEAGKPACHTLIIARLQPKHGVSGPARAAAKPPGGWWFARIHGWILAKKSCTACLAKRRAGPSTGNAWSCVGPICVFSTDFERSRRGAHAHRPPDVQFSSHLPQSEDLGSTDGPVRVHARRFAKQEVNISNVQAIWVPNAICILPHFVCLPGAGAARWPLFSPPACSQPRGSLPGWGRPFFSSQLARTRATKHEAAHEETNGGGL
jgi:hypothetical protein